MKGDLREANQGKTGKHYSLVQSRFNRNSNDAEVKENDLEEKN